MKNIILLAPPAAGKGTQGKLISETYHIPTISIGEIMRNARNPETEVGRIIIECQDNRKLVPLDITLKLMKDRINEKDCENGYILDGFPRSIEQAEEYDRMLKEMGKDEGIVIFMDIDKDLAFKRTMSRIVCPTCGSTYNLLVPELKPKEENICDNCHNVLKKRTDDNEETFYKGFNTYIENTFDLNKYYEDKKILRKVIVDEEKTPQELFEEIKEILEND